MPSKQPVEPPEVSKILLAVADFIEGSGKPGPGGIDIVGGIPSEIYVAIGRERYDDEYEVADATAEAVRTNLARFFRSDTAVRLITEPQAPDLSP